MLNELSNCIAGLKIKVARFHPRACHNSLLTVYRLLSPKRSLTFTMVVIAAVDISVRAHPDKFKVCKGWQCWRHEDCKDSKP